MGIAERAGTGDTGILQRAVGMQLVMMAQEPARGPFPGLNGAFWCHFPEDLRYGRAAIHAHLLWRRLSGGDFIKVMNEYAHPLPAQVERAAAFRGLAEAPQDAGYYRHQLAILRGIVDRTRGRYPVFATVLNPFGQMRDRYGWPRLAGWIAEDADAVAAGMAAVAEALARFARACIEIGGADGIFYASQGGEADMLDDAEFEALVARPDRIVLAAATAASPHTILHVCGAGLALGRYRDYPAAAVNWDCGRNAPADGFWPQACRMPGLDLRGPLVAGDRAAIAAAVRALREAAPGGQQVLAAACSVPGDLPFWRMRAALAAAAPEAAPAPRPNPLDLLAWQALKGAARLRGAAKRRLSRYRARLSR